MQDYRKLDVWRKAHDLALDLRALTLRTPPPVDDQVTDALRQRALHVSVSIVLGCDAEDPQSFARAMRGAAVAVNELRYLLLFARDAKVLAEVPYAKLEARVNQLAAMLGGLNRTVRLTLEGQRPAASRADRRAAAVAPGSDSSRQGSRPPATP